MDGMKKSRLEKIRWWSIKQDLNDFHTRKILKDLLEEIDRLRPDFKPIDEVELGELVHRESYWITIVDVNAVSIKGKKPYVKLVLWNGANDTWDDEEGYYIGDGLIVTHVAEFKYPEPPVKEE